LKPIAICGVISMNKKYKGIERLQSRYGYMFVAPFIIGFIVFFAVPLFQSLWFSFSDVTFTAEGVKTDYVGIESYVSLLTEDAGYVNSLTSSLTSVLYSLPIIVFLSVILALILNQKFRGRIFFRALYFMPVIIATGVVIELMFETTSSDIEAAGVSSAITGSMFGVEDVVMWLNLPDNIAVYIKNIINNIFDLVWSCGIQTVLYIAGLQSIPRSLYEASRVEGATKWEEFWFITFPMLGNVTLLVFIFTMVDLFTSTRNMLVGKAYTMMESGIYDITSSMLWFYFMVVALIMGVALLLYHRLLLKHWQ